MLRDPLSVNLRAFVLFIGKQYAIVIEMRTKTYEIECIIVESKHNELVSVSYGSVGEIIWRIDRA